MFAALANAAVFIGLANNEPADVAVPPETHLFPLIPTVSSATELSVVIDD